nr:MAG TPA: RNA pseudouridylate synthase [Caudoviricetes sp.]
MPSFNGRAFYVVYIVINKPAGCLFIIIYYIYDTTEKVLFFLVSNPKSNK